MNKKCLKCGRLKTLPEFNFKYRETGRRNARCKLCTREDSKKTYYKNHDYYLKYRARLNRVLRIKVNKFLYNYFCNHPCVDCGLSDPIVLHFDHVRGKKIMNVSAMRSGRIAFKKVLEEIEKCAVRCANCHARKTAREQGWYNYLN